MIDVDDRELARMLGLARVALGIASFIAPTRFVRIWTGERSDAAVTTMAVRGLGARDVAIGVGLLNAIENDGSARGWLEASALSDAADAVGTLAEWGRLPGLRRLGMVALEIGSAIVGLRLAANLD